MPSAFIFAFSLFFLLPAFCIAGPKASIKLGAVVSLSGDAARNGEEWLRGARLAVEDSRASPVTVELIVEDDNTNPMKAVTAFNKLVSLDKVQGVVGGTWDFLAETLYPLAEKAKIPFVTPTNPIEVFSASARSNSWVFTNGLSLRAGVNTAGEFLIDRKIRTIGLITIDVPYGNKHAELLREKLSKLGVTLSFERKVTYQGFNDDIRRAALEVLRVRPEAIFVVLNYAGVDLLLREIERAQPQPLVLMTHTLLEAAELGQFAQRFKNAFGIYQRLEPAAIPARKEILEPGYAANGYDAVHCLSQAIAARTFPIHGPASFVCHGITGMHRFSSAERELVTTAAQVMRLDRNRLVRAD